MVNGRASYKGYIIAKASGDEFKDFQGLKTHVNGFIASDDKRYDLNGKSNACQYGKDVLYSKNLHDSHSCQSHPHPLRTQYIIQNVAPKH